MLISQVFSDSETTTGPCPLTIGAEGPDTDFHTRRIPKRRRGWGCPAPRRGPAPPGEAPPLPAPACPASAASPCFPRLQRVVKMAATVGRFLRASVSGCRLGTGADDLWWLRERASQTESHCHTVWGTSARLGGCQLVTDPEAACSREGSVRLRRTALFAVPSPIPPRP